MLALRRAGFQPAAFAVCCVLCALLALLVSVLPAAAPPAKPSASVEKLHKAVGGEDHAEAKRLADVLLQSPSPADRLAASLVYGRILLATGQKDQARQYLAGMKKLAAQALQPDAANAAQLMEVYAAWLAFLDGREDEALKSLEQMLIDKKPGSATAEAADVLAILYLKGQDRAAAKRAVDFGLASIKYDKSGGGKFPPYIETLLKNRLKTDSGDAFPEAKRLYDQAEKLRQEGKFADAGKLFTEVSAKWPRSVWSHAAGFRIGQCLLGLNRAAEAQAHWRAFVVVQASRLPGAAATACSPLPWRGQAAIALVDLTLQIELDVKTARELAHAAGSVLDKGPDEESKPSWDAAAFDIRLRQGVLDLVLKHPEQAAQAFEQARVAGVGSGPSSVVSSQLSVAGSAKQRTTDHGPLTSSPHAGLEKLLDSAKSNWPLIPADLLLGDQRLGQALAIATAYNLCARHEPAAGLFDAVLSGSQRKSLGPFRSFAAQGKARALVGQAVGSGKSREQEAGGGEQKGEGGGQKAAGGAQRADGGGQKAEGHLLQAKAAYLRSLDESPTAAWHEETLRELALLIKDLAELKAEGGRQPASHSPDSRDSRAAFQSARAAALPYWLALIEKFPQSRHLPEALYHAGVLFSESSPKHDAEKSAAHFERLVKEYPQSPWTGDAHVRLIDVCLEQRFDLATAERHAQAAVKWLAEQGAGGPSSVVSGPSSVAGSANQLTTDNGQLTTYSIFLRAGLIEYLQERCPKAVEWFEKAKPFAPPRDFVVVHGTIPTGIEKLIELAKSGKYITPDEVRKGDPTARVILMLADVYHEGEEWQKSLDLCTRVIEPKGFKPTNQQRSWAHFKRGRNLFCLGPGRRDPDAAHDDYLAAARTHAAAPWADKAIFLAGNIQWNFHGNADGAIRLWQRVLEQYPKSDEAERSAYYIGTAYYWSARPIEAEKALERFLATRPDSHFAGEARKWLEKARQEKSDERGRRKEGRGKSTMTSHRAEAK